MHEVETYILNFPENVQEILNKIRSIVKETASDAVEIIAYGMPAYKTHGKPLIYFAGYKNHIGLYATPSGHKAFEQELANYKQGKGSVQFPLNQDIPFDLIQRIVEFKMNENLAKRKK